MSSTKRGGKRSDADFYPTPRWVVDRLLDRKILPDTGSWLEAGAGNGDIIEAVNKHPHYAGRIDWTAAELRETCAPKLEALTGKLPIIGDFTAMPPAKRFDVCIANPPFAVASEFLHTARQQSKLVCFLLRLNFLQSTSRAAWLCSDVPDVFLIPDRPSFTGDGKTDSVAYAWMIWEGYGHPLQKFSRGWFQILDTTPLRVRR